jgi:hypothetical protein
MLGGRNVNETLLNKAKDTLMIQEVYLRHANAFIEFDTDPDTINSLIETEDYEAARSTTSLRIEELEFNDKKVWEYHFYFFSGVRKLMENEVGINDEKEASKKPLFNISAVFDAVYHSKEELDENVLNEFMKHNVAYHVWPYWREHLHSMCSKMNLSKIEVPHYVRTTEQDEPSVD